MSIQKVMQGGKNSYRDVWLSLMHDTIIDFAEYIRARLDEVAPEIPIIACSCFDTWGSDGYDSIELTEILAGKGNRKILRTIGAPYHYDSRNFIHGVEITRMQANWCAGKGIETMCEGDVYPRPRYAAPSQALELYDIALRCVRATDGILKYMFDYVNDAEYETGYVDRHVKNGNIREQLEQIFEGKSPVGIRIVSHKGLIESWDLPYNKADEIKNLVYNFGPGAVAGEILSHDAIPTVYGHSGDYPIALFGENAKYISDEDLKNGAFLDAKAAKILHDRGIDTGIISYEEAVCASEELNDDHTSVVDYGSMTINKMRVSEKAHVLSILKPLNSPGAYLYENEDGLRFYCIAIGEFTQPSNLYIAHYLLQEQRVKALEWTGRKHLPAVCKRNPHLYQIASEDAETGSLAVLLANNFMDNIPTPRVTLGRNFSRIRFVNCTGELNGNKVTLSEISPYGFAAFEVSP